MIIVTSSLSKSFVFKMFLSTPKRKAGVLKFLWFKERLRKAPFSGLISADRRLNQTKKAAFSNSSGLKSVSEKLRFRY